MQLYDIVKLRGNPDTVGQITSDGQDHGKYARLNLDAEVEITLRNGSKKRAKVREIETDLSSEERLGFIHDNPHYLP